VNIFRKYASYYNLLYRDKDYDGEVEFLEKLLQKHRPGARSILDLGCGSGTHASLLARRGYEVHGVDISQDMLDLAGHARSQLPEETASRLSFSLFDHFRKRCFPSHGPLLAGPWEAARSITLNALKGAKSIQKQRDQVNIRHLAESLRAIPAFPGGSVPWRT